MRAALVAAALAGCTSPGSGDDQICAAVAISLRDPSTGECQAFDTGACQGIGDPDWASCAGPCDTLDEVTCVATAGCRAIYTGHVCPPDGCTTAPDLTYEGCWGTSPSQHLAGQNCWNLDAYDCSSDQDCAAVFAASPATPPLSWETCMPEPAP